MSERIHRKKWEEALLINNKLLELQPENYELYITKAAACMGIQNYHDAAEAYQVALDADFSDNKDDEWKKHLELCYRILGREGNVI